MALHVSDVVLLLMGFGVGVVAIEDLKRHADTLTLVLSAVASGLIAGLVGLAAMASEPSWPPSFDPVTFAAEMSLLSDALEAGVTQ